MSPVDLDAIQAVLIRVFLVVTMLSIGLHVTGSHVLARLRQPTLIAGSLIINFVALPAIVWSFTRVVDLPDGITVGLIVTAVAAGGSFGPKLVELSGGDVAFAVGLMFLMDVVATLAVAPIASLLLATSPGIVGVDPAPIVVSVVLFQAIPLIAGLTVSRLRPAAARRARSSLVRSSNVLLGALTVVILLNNTDDLLGLGSLPVAVMILSICAALALGALLGGDQPGLRRTLALTTAQRNTALALLVVTELHVPAAVAVVVAFALGQLLINGGVAVALGRRRPLDGVLRPATS